jgi:hypothetical protein
MLHEKEGDTIASTITERCPPGPVMRMKMNTTGLAGSPAMATIMDNRIHLAIVEAFRVLLSPTSLPHLLCIP